MSAFDVFSAGLMFAVALAYVASLFARERVWRLPITITWRWSGQWGRKVEDLPTSPLGTVAPPNA